MLIKFAGCQLYEAAASAIAGFLYREAAPATENQSLSKGDNYCGIAEPPLSRRSRVASRKSVAVVSFCAAKKNDEIS